MWRNEDVRHALGRRCGAGKVIERIKVGQEPERGGGVAEWSLGAGLERVGQLGFCDRCCDAKSYKDGAGGQATARHGVRTRWRHGLCFRRVGCIVESHVGYEQRACAALVTTWRGGATDGGCSGSAA